MSGQKPWADGPFQLISSTRAGSKVSALEAPSKSRRKLITNYEQKGVKTTGVNRLAEDMTIVHNFILRIINTVYLQCINVEKSPDDVQDFVSYAMEWGKMVEEHHETEETEVFTEIEELAGVPGLMQANVAQHEAFHDGLHAYMSYLEKVQKGEEAYNGEKLKRIIDSFMHILREHLSDEIDTLLKLEEYDRNWEEWYEKLMKKLLGKMGDAELKTTMIPLLLTNRDKTFEEGVHAWWPPVPWFVFLMMRWFYIPAHKSWWRFSSCDDRGAPKELPFA
ncbi:hemerythrin HHE cation binding domain-containing protein [Colletotrichum orchidophilum]|uniref:Hemerythrin HHE cation binding domain-containing protein n=1 Tax=Colletotrichum orchidophilum TaxID=1209926 RepID=A0A1G4BJ46_9PEZI|nr:hemerythrin HHE cation binding domain-containing protein [Colletotrichum orchidophilum]OHF01441.1 hemerythrin HHE cation binding domain-containing protein [Colletotrichum orchidophilum]